MKSIRNAFVQFMCDNGDLMLDVITGIVVAEYGAE